MNNANFKSSLSSKLEFRLEFCWLPVPGQREDFTGLLICIICRTTVILGLKICEKMEMKIDETYHCLILNREGLGTSL